MATHDEPPEPSDRDERVVIPLDPEQALRALLKVDPDAEPAAGEKPKAGSRKKA